MNKQILSIALIAMMNFLASVTDAFSIDNEFRNSHRRLKMGNKPVVGYWPISNSNNASADVLTDPFGPRLKSANGPWDYHEGIDIRAQSALSTYAAFDGWIYRVEANPNNDVASYIILRHVDPFDNTTFYTRYFHLTYTQDLADLNDWEEISGNASEMIDAPFAPQFFVTPNKSYLVNPIAASGNSGGVPYHLHFEGMVGGTNPVYDAINPMRDDSLPYDNNHIISVGGVNHLPGRSAIYNAGLTLVPGTTLYNLTFRIETHHQELDLEVIEVSNFFDGVGIDFYDRTNTDAAGSPDPDPTDSDQTSFKDENGMVSTYTTNLRRPINITIAPQFFTPGTNQIIDFTFKLPLEWNGYNITIRVYDSEDLFYEQFDLIWTRVEEGVEKLTPSIFTLSPNFPNPFNPSTTIRFAVPQKSLVSLAIYDERGGLVRELASDKLYQPGWNEVLWDGTNAAGLPVSSGVYFYRMRAQGLHDKRSFTQTRKLTLLR